MCGLAGLASPGDAAPLRALALAMAARLAHRGPDGEGLHLHAGAPGQASVALAHRRLAIIDRSVAAAQPMASADGALVVVLNGEIVNHEELRAELTALGAVFRSRADTEVLLAAWRAWGADALGRFEGMFAFALLDRARGELVLARDPFGIKPLYWARSGTALAFASEIPPMLALPGVSRRVAPAPLAEYLAHSVNGLPGTTLFADVFELPAAHLARVPLDGALAVQPARWWMPGAVARRTLRFSEAVEALRARLATTVERHLRADVPVGILCSGGLDSSGIVGLAARVPGRTAPLATFSFRADDGAVDEGPWQRAVRDATGAVGHEVRVSADEWARDLPALVASQGEPFASPVIYVQRRLFQCAAEQGIGVVLDGQGGDELFAGYDRFVAGRVASWLRRGRIDRVALLLVRRLVARAPWRAPAAAGVSLAWPALATARARDTGGGLADGAWLDAHVRTSRPVWRSPDGEVLRAMVGQALQGPSLPWLLRYADRNAMAFGIENRVPYLERVLADFVLALPERHLLEPDGRGKALLRAALRDVVPEPVRTRRARIGFDVPVEAWLGRTPGAASLLEDAMALPPVSATAARPLLDAVRRGAALSRPQAFAAWRLVTLAAWGRAFDATFA